MQNEKIEMLTCTAQDLAEHFGVSVRRIRQLTEDGILCRIATNKYIFTVSLYQYIVYRYEIGRR